MLLVRPDGPSCGKIDRRRKFDTILMRHSVTAQIRTQHLLAVELEDLQEEDTAVASAVDTLAIIGPCATSVADQTTLLAIARLRL